MTMEKGYNNSSQNAQHVKPCGRWATTAIDRERFHFCQPITEAKGYSEHRIIKTGEQKKQTNIAWSDEFLLTF